MSADDLGMTSTTAPAPSPRRITPSVQEMLAGADRRERFDPEQRRSTAHFERVWIDGEPHIVKFLRPDDDFMLRALDDPGARTLKAFEAGLFDTAPDAIDHAVVAAAPTDEPGCAFLMRDVSAELVPAGDDPFPEEQHRSFVEHLARMCASTWGWTDTIGLAPYGGRWTFTAHRFLEAERRRGDPERAATIVTPGWEQFAQRAPRAVAHGIESLRHDLKPLVSALQQTPSCFLHGDWKASNLGTGADGRTVLIDWVYLGEGPACHDLAWYLALNRRKLPTAKEQVISEFRTAVERNGVDTGAWWDRQLGLALLGAVVQFGWDKALGDEAELGWWCDRATEALLLL